MFTLRLKKILDGLRRYLKEGMSCKKASLCITLGIVLGIFPVLGTTTILCAVVAIILRLNLPLIQLVNYAVYPLQLLLTAFFYGVGSWLFTGHKFLYSGAEIVGMLQDDMWGGIVALWDITLSAILLWILIGPVLAVFLYAMLTPVIRKLLPVRHASVSGSENLD